MKNLYIIAASAVLLSLAACSNEADIPQVSTEPVAVEFSGNIAQTASTRASGTTWDNGDAIGISCTSGGKTYTNVKYTTTGTNGKFTVAEGASAIYYQDINYVDFKAYYPYNELTGDATTITADTREQNKQKQFDFMYATTIGDKEDKYVIFEFSHKMSKVELTIKKGTDISFEEVKAATLILVGGFKNMASFDTTTGTATATGTTLNANWEFTGTTNVDYKAPVVTNEEAETLTYTLILAPQELIAKLPIIARLEGKQEFKALLDFRKANEKFDNDAAINEWKPGVQYNVTVTLNKTGIEVTGSTIQDWGQVDAGTFEAK